MNKNFIEKIKNISNPSFKGSYSEDDCIFILKDISNIGLEEANEVREQKLTKGVHYSEMLPVESAPSQDYLNLFHKSLKESYSLIAQYVADVSELIVKEKGLNTVLVSLARAGTPIGVLIKRYIKEKYEVSLPHYSISIIRGKGFDENAVAYIVNKHQTNNLQFIDGWTGKGVIGTELSNSTKLFKEKYDIEIDSTLAVLADPSCSTSIYGTREDFLIPSACLNSSVSGLASRTVHKEEIIGENDFHGAKYYKEWESVDLSNFYVDEISKHFQYIHPNVIKKGEVLNSGLKEIMRIREEFSIRDINKIKPGVGETTRVLLRRVPWKILIDSFDNNNLKHILLLAKEKNINVEVYKDMTYSCIGLIKEQI